LADHLLNALPLLLLVGFCLFLMRQMQAGGNKALSFGKSRATTAFPRKQEEGYVQRCSGNRRRPRKSYRKLSSFLKDPQKFQKLGGRIPKGVLLVGPPGTGKTLCCARRLRVKPSVARSSRFPVGLRGNVLSRRGREPACGATYLKQGKKNAPCIIFIDEIDAVGRHQRRRFGRRTRRTRTDVETALLVEMDGFEIEYEGVILIAATNRRDVLDPGVATSGKIWTAEWLWLAQNVKRTRKKSFAYTHAKSRLPMMSTFRSSHAARRDFLGLTWKA